MKMLTGSWVAVGKGRDVGGSITIGVEAGGCCVGNPGSAVTVTGVGAALVRVGSTVAVGTSVVSICCCGVVVRLQPEIITARDTTNAVIMRAENRTLIEPAMKTPLSTLHTARHSLIIAVPFQQNLTFTARHTNVNYLWLK